MHLPTPTRHGLPHAMAAAVLAVCCLATGALAQGRGHGAPPTSHNSYPPEPNVHRPLLNTRPGGEHLSQWMNRHSSLPLPEQQRALEHEPGFRDLSPPVQQRMRDRLTELNNMSPQQRQRVIDHTEAIEHLAPEQRQQFRGTMQQLSSLPQDRRRAVSRAFHEYRNLPPEQRQAALNSGRLTGSLSPEERSTFNNLVTVEPYLPPPTPRLQPRPQPEPGLPANGLR